MTVPSMFSMKRAVATMRAVRTAEGIGDSEGQGFLGAPAGLLQGEGRGQECPGSHKGLNAELSPRSREFGTGLRPTSLDETDFVGVQVWGYIRVVGERSVSQ